MVFQIHQDKKHKGFKKQTDYLFKKEKNRWWWADVICCSMD